MNRNKTAAPAPERYAVDSTDFRYALRGLRLQAGGDSHNDMAAGIDCKSIRQPIGVFAGISPFNFPAMAPAWMYPFAIACGNTFVLKPSEKVPLTPTQAVGVLHEAGRPPGVLNPIHGGKQAVDALLHHPLVKAFFS